MRLDEGLSPGEQADLDRLELELRKLGDVVAVGFEGAGAGSPVAEGDVLTVHVLVGDPSARAAVEQQAVDLGRLHLGRPLRVVVAPDGDEPVGFDAAAAPALAALLPSRVRLVGVTLGDDGRSVNVSLAHGETVAIGHDGAATQAGAVRATLGAIRELGWPVPWELGSTVRLSLGTSSAVLVQLGGPGGDRLGVSGGASAEEAACKATLQALNRWLDDPARRPMTVRPGSEAG